MEKRKAKVLALGVRRSKAVRVPWLWVLGVASLPGCLTETQRTMIDSPEDEAPPPPVPSPTSAATHRHPVLLDVFLPTPITPTRGCLVHPPCSYAMMRVRQVQPALREVQPGHWA